MNLSHLFDIEEGSFVLLGKESYTESILQAIISITNKKMRIIRINKDEIEERIYKSFIFKNFNSISIGEILLPDFFEVKEGENKSSTIEMLEKAGFRKSPSAYEFGEFSVIGDTIDINIKLKIRLIFGFQILERIYIIEDEEISRVKRCFIPYLKGELKPYDKKIDFDGFLPQSKFIRGEEDIKKLRENGYKIFFFDLEDGVIFPERKIAILSQQKEKKRRREGKLVYPKIFELSENMYVVHPIHGVGILRGTIFADFLGSKREFLKIEYKNKSFLYIPAEDIGILRKWIGPPNPPLDTLGGKTFEIRKRRVKEKLERNISEYMRVYALRKSIWRERYDIDLAREIISKMQETFEFIDTPDQEKVTEEIVKDLCEKDYPMDRVIVGDSAVGKTEIAFRTAAIVALSGKQVAFLSPTTPLALQTFIRAKERFSLFPVKIEMLSRLTKKKEKVLKEIEEGKVDIVIGTHAILHANFKDLGLLIVDEEQKFGVEDKEKMLKMKTSTDYLFISATPIPRTLKMALSGIKDISIIRTKPFMRKKIFTIFDEYSESIVKNAIEKEIERGGQVIYIHPRIEDEEEILKKIEEILKKINRKAEKLNGKMKKKEIEDILIRFILGEIDVLVSTPILAVGVDFPSCNTLIVDKAELFGFSDLYHIRGRVGRGDKEGYCYFLWRKFSPKLKEMEDIFKIDFDNVGLQVALRDLEMRGAGNLFGKEQIGHIAEVGFETYLTILEEVIEEVKEKIEKIEYFEPKVDVNIPAFIPENLVPDPNTRLGFYRAYALAENEEELEEILLSICDYAKVEEPPQELKNFHEIMKLKLVMKEKNIYEISFSSQNLIADIIGKNIKKRISVKGDPIKFAIEHIKNLNIKMDN